MGNRALGTRKSRNLAKRDVRDIHGRLEKFPQSCPIAPENDHLEHEIRHLIIGRYRVISSISQHTVTVLHIRGAYKHIRGAYKE